VEVGQLDGLRRELDGALGRLERGPVVARAGCGVVEDGGCAGVHGAVGPQEQRRGGLPVAGEGILHEAQRPRVAAPLQARERLIDLGAHGGIFPADAGRLPRRPAGGVRRWRSRVWCGGSLFAAHGNVRFGGEPVRRGETL